MVRLTHIFITVFLFSMGSCRHTDSKSRNNIPVDSLKVITSPDKGLNNEPWAYLKDTLTSDGWFINYLISKDSAIYIQWSKGAKRGRKYAGDISDRFGFITSYIGEDSTHIFLWQRCATDCQTIFAADKNEPVHVVEYFGIVDYDLQYSQILSSLDNESKDSYSFRLFDLKKNKEYDLQIKGYCAAVKVDYCIDTIIFGHSQLTIRTSFSDKAESDKTVAKTSTIKL